MKKHLTTEQTAARDARRAAAQALFARLAKMGDVERVALAASMPIVTCDGHELSTANMCLVGMQFPTATVVGGFRQWLRHGRCVRKGEHGAVIRVPGGLRKTAEGFALVEMTKATGGEPDGMFFVTGTVFDVSQTEVVEMEVAA